MADERPSPAAAGGVEDAWRRAMDANIRFYRAWGELTAGWVREVTAVGASLTPTTLGLGRTSTTATSVGARAAPPAAETPPQAAASVPVLVLEAPGGQSVSASFLVENSWPHPVEGRVGTGDFHSDTGGSVEMVTRFDPESLSLAPGESRLVRVTVEVPEGLAQGVDHRSTISVSDVPGTTIPVLVRRLADPTG